MVIAASARAAPARQLDSGAVIDRPLSIALAPQVAPVVGMVNRAASTILFVVVALCPLPFGSTDPITVALWCVVLGVGLASASLRLLDRRRLALIWISLALLPAYALVLHEQLAAQPWFAAAGPHEIWHKASEILGMAIAPSVSIARNQPLFALGPPLAAMLAFLCSLIVCADRAMARRLFWVVALSGAAYAIYGIGAFLVDPAKVLWREKQAYGSVLTATFINRNTAAVYFGSCAMIWLMAVLEHVRREVRAGDDWRASLRGLMARPPRAIVLAFCAFFVCLAAMFMTGSRAGVVISLAALLAVAIWFLRGVVVVRRKFWLMLGGAAVAVLVLLQVMGAGVQARFDTEGLASGGRLETYRSTLRMIADHPWFGSGLGTFVWSYPAYRGDEISMWGIWDRAHSTPLEIAADMGLPLAGAVAAWWLMVLGMLWHGVRVRRRDRDIPFGALMIAAIALAHSMIDFSLQIPGFAIVVFALAGAGVAQSFRTVRGV